MKKKAAGLSEESCALPEIITPRVLAPGQPENFGCCLTTFYSTPAEV